MSWKHVSVAGALIAVACASFAIGQQQARKVVNSQVKALKREQAAKELEEKLHAQSESDLIEEALYSLHARGEAFQELERRRGEQVRRLIEVAGEKDGPPMTRYFAFRLLGLYRDPHAIEVLLRNLDFEYRDVVTEASYLTGYPAAEALAQFGSEGGIAVLNNLVRDSAKPATEEMLRLRSFVLESTLPRESRAWQGDDVVGVVERYIERIPPQWTEGKRNVERLLEKIKKPPKER